MVLDNARHELFAQSVARGVPQNDAYVQAGFESESDEAISANASRLAAKPDVAERIAELLARAAKRADLKAADVMQMLMDDRALARQLGQPSAAIRGAELLGKQIGMFTEKKEIRVGSLDNLTIDQLDEIIAATQPGPTGRAGEGGGAGQAGSQDQDVLPGHGTAAAGAIPETP